MKKILTILVSLMIMTTSVFATTTTNNIPNKTKTVQNMKDDYLLIRHIYEDLILYNNDLKNESVTLLYLDDLKDTAKYTKEVVKTEEAKLVCEDIVLAVTQMQTNRFKAEEKTMSKCIDDFNKFITKDGLTEDMFLLIAKDYIKIK